MKCTRGSFEIDNRIFVENPEIYKYNPTNKTYLSVMPKLLIEKDDWFALTPLTTIQHALKTIKRAAISTLSPNRNVFCAFSGVGGDSLVLMKEGYRVTCNDISYQKIKFLKANKRIMEEEYKIKTESKFILKDFFEVDKSEVEKPLFAFVTPPWGGISYKDNKNISEFLEIDKIKQKIDSLSDNAVYFLPLNLSDNEIEEVFGNCKIQRCSQPRKLDGVLVYTGNLFF